MNVNKWHAIIFKLISSVCLEATIRKLRHVTSNWVIFSWEKTPRINSNELKKGSSNLTGLVPTSSLQCTDLVLINFQQPKEKCSRSLSTLSTWSGSTADLVSEDPCKYLQVLKKSKNCKKSWKKIYYLGENLANRRLSNTKKIKKRKIPKNGKS